MPLEVPLPTLVEAVSAHGLAGSTLAFPAEPLMAEQWGHLLALVRAQRVPGFLLQAIHSGRMPATPEQLDAASNAHLESMRVSVALERTLLQSVGALDEAGIPSRVLKGPAIAHLVYPDPSLRSFHDVDVMVPGADFDRAVEVLGRAGCRRMHRTLAPGFDARFGKGATLETSDGYEVDLHRSFVGGRFGLTIRLQDLFETSSAFHLAGRELCALGPEERFLHACYHAAVGDPAPRLVSLRDIAEMLLHTTLDLDRVRGLCSDWGGLPIMARAVRATWQTFGLADLTALSVWAERYQPSRSEERAVRAYTSQRSGGGQALTALGAVPGLRAKAAFIRAVALPESDFRAATDDHQRRAWLRRGMRSALRLHGRRPE